VKDGKAVSSLDRREVEDRILELAEQGRVVAAVNLTRRAYGYGLREARQFVQELIRG